MGVPRHAVVAILVMGIGMFNFVKYALIAAITMQLYIPLKAALTKAKLLPEPEGPEGKTKELSVSSILVSVAVVVICIVGILYLNGILFFGG